MNWRRDIVGIVTVAGFIAVCIIVLKGGVIEITMKDVGLILVGMLASKFGTVVDYHYGSSSGSSAKNQTIADTAKATSTAVTDTARAASTAVTETAKAAAAKVP